MEHELKLWVQSWYAIHDGSKTWEARVDDRGFEVGDVLVLHPYEPDLMVYVEEMHDLVVKVTHKQTFGMADGFVGLSFQLLTKCSCKEAV